MRLAPGDMLCVQDLDSSSLVSVTHRAQLGDGLIYQSDASVHVRAQFTWVSFGPAMFNHYNGARSRDLYF